MGDGRKDWAPCGHMGEVVIGTYVQCPTCDKLAVPDPIDPEKTPPMARMFCPGCGSHDTEEFEDDVDAALWYIQQAHIPTGTIMPPSGLDWHCWRCGKVWTP